MSPSRQETDPTRIFCGVDVGASATKLVLLHASGETLASVVRLSGIDYAETARLCLEAALRQAKLEAAAVVRTVSTGYGRRNVTFADAALTEIHCHGIGCFHVAPKALTIVDIGGQDNKVIRLNDSGKRLDFKMNRKCAAGTGAFVEEIALRLGLNLGELEGLAASTSDSVRLSSFCTVFAKTEILSHLRHGVPVAQIVRGAFESVINRILEMDPLMGEVMATGGVVAHNPTIVAILSSRLGRPVAVPPEPQLTGALGAALQAREQAA
jgi:(R)-2-hydroxyacyl-CoA dehydratese activating ATPase